MTEQQILNQAKRLIKIPSTVDNPQALHAVIDVIAGMLGHNSEITVERFMHKDTPSLLAYAGSMRPARFAVILNGHLDVIAGKVEQFEPLIRDGKLFGRGAHDMKTAAVIMTDVFRRMATTVPYALGLQIVCDEEIGGYSGTNLQIGKGVRTDFAIMGEHSFQKDAIYTAARGIAWVEVKFTGTTAHGGYVWHGDNAILRASKFTQTLLERYPIPEAELWGTTVNVANLHTTDTVYNRVPDSATLHLDFRFVPGDSHFKNRQSVRKFLQSIDPDIAVTFHLMEPPMSVSSSNSYLHALAAAARQEIHQEPVFLSRYAGGDARHYTKVGGHCVEYGLMGSGPHSDHEYVEIDSILSYQRILEHFLQDAGNVARPDEDTLALAAGA